jgi:hypothetical protein
MLPTNAVFPLVIFIALLLAVSLHGLAASGQFPREHRAPALRSGGGATILFGSIAVAIVCLLVGAVVAWRLVPWYAMIIGGGATVLATPLVLQRFPDRFVDGRGALVAFAGAGTLLALVMIWIALAAPARP